MLYNYIAVVFFVVVALFVPISFLMAAKMLRHRSPQNPVKSAPYESAESTMGRNRDVMNEYLPYFMLFVPFEVATMVLLLWAAISKSVPYIDSLLVVGMAVMAMLFSLAGYIMIRVNNVPRSY